MRNLWTGESHCREQADYTVESVSMRTEEDSTDLTDSTAEYDPTPLKYLKSDAYDDKSQSHLTQRQSNLRRLEPIPYPDSVFDQLSLGLFSMAPIVGTYQHVRNENIDEYFKAIGVPYIGRKMMSASNPRLEISKDGDKWTIRNVSMMRTAEFSFTLGAEYEESMPSGETLKNVTTVDGDSLVTISISTDNSKLIRTYEFTEDGAILTMTHEKSGQVAKRFYKRLT